jgi:hypothetical protein
MAIDLMILVATVAFVASICLAIGYALGQEKADIHVERIRPRHGSIDEALEVLQMFVDADEKARSLKLHASALRRARSLLKRGDEN